MLTPNIDVATAHTFNANPVMSSTGDTRWDTLNSGDKLTGDGVGSVLNIITVDDAQGAGGQSDTTNILPTISNVETLNAQVYHDLTINSQFITGMKNVNLQALQNGKLSMIGVNSKLENINLSNLENNKEQNDVDFIVNADQLSATDDVLNVSLNNVVQGKAAISTIDVTSTSDLGTYETLNIASNGAKTNQIFLKSNSANLGISGGAVEIDARDAALLATVDATASAGNVKLYNVNATSVKLGDGDDIISINNFNEKTTIDTGAGADLVAIKGSQNNAKELNITAEKLNNISNAETIRLSGEDATIDFNKLTNGVKNFEVASDLEDTNSFTFNNVAAGSTFKVITNDWLGFSNPNGTASYSPTTPPPYNFNLDKYGSTVQALNLNGTKGAATSVTLTNNNANVSLDIGNVPTLRTLKTDSNDLSLVSTGKYANTITNLTAGSGSATAPATVAIKISGDQDLTVSRNLDGIANVKNFKVDASELTGDLTIQGSNARGSGDLAHSDVIIGGSGGDKIATGDQYHGTVATQAVAARLVFDVNDGTNANYTTNAGTTITLKIGNVGYTVAAGDNPGTTTAAQLLDVLKKATKDGTVPPELITTKYAISIDSTNATNGKLIFTQVSGQEGSIDLTTTNNTFSATGGAKATLSNTSGENIQGSAAVDAVKGSYNVLTGNDGADLFAFNKFKDGEVTTQKLVTAEITDFKSGEDKIVFNNTGFIDPATNVDVDPTTTRTVDAANFKKGDVYQSMDELFAAAIKVFKDDANVVAPATAPANKIQYFVGQVGNDTYLFNDGGNIAANVLGEFRDAVKLTGVDLAGIQASDIYGV